MPVGRDIRFGQDGVAHDGTVANDLGAGSFDLRSEGVVAVLLAREEVAPGALANDDAAIARGVHLALRRARRDRRRDRRLVFAETIVFVLLFARNLVYALGDGSAWNWVFAGTLGLCAALAGLVPRVVAAVALDGILPSVRILRYTHACAPPERGNPRKDD
jgi:hypothetical protein